MIVSNKWGVYLALLAGFGFTAIAGTGNCKDNGSFKLGYAGLAIASFLAAKELSYTAETQDLEEEEYQNRMRLIRDEEFRIDAENHVSGYRVQSEQRVIDRVAPGHTIDVPAQPVQVQALPQATTPTVEIPVPQAQQQAIAVPAPLPNTQPQQVQALPVQSQPQQQQVVLPDGARLIEAGAIADINKYPVVMVVATPGNGKTQTVNWVFSHLPGKKVLCSHKAEGYHRNMYDLVFGYNPHSDRSRWVGDNSILTTEDRDFEFIANQQGGCGSVAQGYWALFAEITKRQQLGPSRVEQLEFYRNFYDETSYAYSTAFQDPLNPDLLKWGQSLVGSTNKLTFFDARTNRNQIFFAAQSASVDIIGLKGLAKARDEMWFLYPGPAAIAYAAQHEKPALSSWLKSRLEQGYAIALMVKQNTFWEIINMPKLADLKAWENSFKTIATQPISQDANSQPSNIYDLVDREKRNEDAA